MATEQLPLTFAPRPPRPRTGGQRRDAVLERQAEMNRRWLRAMQAEAERIARAKGVVSADDLREYAEGLRRGSGWVPTSPNAAGAIFRGPQWEARGWIKSVKPTHNATDLRLWGLRG